MSEGTQEARKPACGNCPYRDGESRECRHDPPRRMTNEGLALWPQVEGDEWCGSHPFIQALSSRASIGAAMSPFKDMLESLKEILPPHGGV